MASLSGDWERAGRAIADRRAVLKMTQEEVAEKGGPSPATLRLLEAGARKSVRSTTVGRLEEVLRWAPGSLRALLAGGEAVPLPEGRTGFTGVQAIIDELSGRGPEGLDEHDELELERRLIEMRRHRDQKSAALAFLRRLQGGDAQP